jgi:hypothetical protein
MDSSTRGFARGKWPKGLNWQFDFYRGLNKRNREDFEFEWIWQERSQIAGVRRRGGSGFLHLAKHSFVYGSVSVKVRSQTDPHAVSISWSRAERCDVLMPDNSGSLPRRRMLRGWTLSSRRALVGFGAHRRYSTAPALGPRETSRGSCGRHRQKVLVRW